MELPRGAGARARPTQVCAAPCATLPAAASAEVAQPSPLASGGPRQASLRPFVPEVFSARVATRAEATLPHRESGGPARRAVRCLIEDSDRASASTSASDHRVPRPLLHPTSTVKLRSGGSGQLTGQWAKRRLRDQRRAREGVAERSRRAAAAPHTRSGDPAGVRPGHAGLPDVREAARKGVGLPARAR